MTDLTDEQLDTLWQIAEDAKQFPQESDHIWKLGNGMPWDECGPIVTNDNELTIVDEMRLPRREFGKHIATFDPPTVQSLIQSLRTERKVHQATQAELEAAREVVEAAWVFRKTPYGYPHDNLLNKLNAYDRNAARAGQEASE